MGGRPVPLRLACLACFAYLARGANPGFEGLVYVYLHDDERLAKGGGGGHLRVKESRRAVESLLLP